MYHEEAAERETRGTIYRDETTRTNAQWFAGAAVGVIILLAPYKTPLVTGIGLSVLFGLLVYPVLKLQLVQRQRNFQRAVFALLLLAIGVSAFGWIVWPQRKYLALTSTQQTSFVQALSEVRTNTRVVLGCSSTEHICAAVGQFIELFQKANWRVRGSAVERGFLTKPQFGVVILVYGTGTIPDPDDPKYGLWTPVVNPERDAITHAFKAINITIRKTMVDHNLRESEIAVIFGPEPPDQ